MELTRNLQKDIPALNEWIDNVKIELDEFETKEPAKRSVDYLKVRLTMYGMHKLYIIIPLAFQLKRVDNKVIFFFSDFLFLYFPPVVSFLSIVLISFIGSHIDLKEWK